MGAKSSNEYAKYYSQELYSPFETILTNGATPTLKFEAPKNFSPDKSSNQPILYQKSSNSTIGSQPFAYKLEEGIENYPACAVGYIESWFGGNIHSTGTGFLIHKNIVMTSANHLFHYQTSQPAKEVAFYPARTRNQGIKLLAKRMFYPKQYKEAHTSKARAQWNFGIMELVKNTHEQYGYLGISFDESDFGASYQKFLYGYPINQQGVEMHKYQGQCKMQEGSIRHNFPASQGVDGGPILFVTSKQVRVIGIYLPNSNKTNKSLKLRSQIHERVKSWLSERRGQLNLSEMALKRQSNGHSQFQLERNDINRHKSFLINIGMNNLGVGGVKLILQADWKNIISLNISENSIANSGLKLLSTIKWPRLNELDLSCNCISSEGIQHLITSSSSWNELQKLNLSENNIGAQGIGSLIACQWPKLTNLNLSGNNIGPRGGLELSKSNWKCLQKISLNQCFLEVEGLYWLTKADWKKLKSLSIAKNNSGDEGITQLLDSHWMLLQELIIDQNKITKIGFKSLTGIHWVNLKFLSARQNQIDGLGFLFLCNSDWKRLEQIDFRWNSVTDGQSLKKTLQLCFQRLKVFDI